MSRKVTKCRHLRLSDGRLICASDKEGVLLSTTSLEDVDKQMLIIERLIMISLARLVVLSERIN
jgi:hypothetical protein